MARLDERMLWFDGMAEPPSLYLTQDDLERLSDLLDAQGGRFAKLEGELARVVVVPREKIPRNVVTMNSRVIFENETTGERREVTLQPESALR